MILAIYLLVCLFGTLTTALPISWNYGENLRANSVPEFPYIVSLRKYYDNNEYKHFCGGTILSPLHILTAAHCLTGLQVENVIVVAGAIRLNSKGYIYPALAFMVHTQYEEFNKWNNDIAIITLGSPIQLIPGFVQRVILPSKDAVLLTGATAVVAGWGNSHDVQSGTSNTLLRVDIIIFSHEMCWNYCYPFSDRRFCAGRLENDKGICQGDSGGPLVVNCVQHGIVSYGHKVKRLVLPTVFTRVSYYLDWIEQKISPYQPLLIPAV